MTARKETHADGGAHFTAAVGQTALASTITTCMANRRRTDGAKGGNIK